VKTQPIRPARIHFAEGEPPAAPDFGDIYHPRVGALEQARHVFLQGNGLPRRWAGQRDFTVLETGFGLGNNFLALWQAWRDDPARCERLHLVSLELHPPRREDLARALAASPLRALADELVAAWPPLAPGLHRLLFEAGRVQLTLALGDAQRLLPLLHLQADALFLDGFAPDRNPAMWSLPLIKALARRCARDATAATWSVSRALHEALSAAGFEPSRTPGIGGKREITQARYAPRFVVPAAAPSPSSALVIGAGIAGAHAAQALARQGLAVTVLEAAGAPAQGASGNRAGLFHGTLDADDSPYARLHRCAALWATHAYREAISVGVAGQVQGLLRLATPRPARTDPHDLSTHQALPAEYVALLGAEAASALAGLRLGEACWFYPGGGWVSPPEAARHALQTPGIEGRFASGVARLARTGGDWIAIDAAGHELARAPVAVIAAAEGSQHLLAGLGHAPLPLARSRGQVTELQGLATSLRLPLAGDGYAIPLPDGLLCGATRDAGDEDPALRDRDHTHNLERLARLTGLDAAGLTRTGRVGWRLHGDDRLPIAGAVPLARMPTGTRLDQARLLPREQGLFVVTALGARGITWAPLLGALVAAQVCGTPWPLEQDLADAIDPGRWLVKRARAGKGPIGRSG
jgi:tRNA 5-methylaminomethyl-2-thiouridine biosynthesis bifunctional protein